MKHIRNKKSIISIFLLVCCFKTAFSVQLNWVYNPKDPFFITIPVYDYSDVSNNITKVFVNLKTATRADYILVTANDDQKIAWYSSSAPNNDFSHVNGSAMTLTSWGSISFESVLRMFNINYNTNNQTINVVFKDGGFCDFLKNTTMQQLVQYNEFTLCNLCNNTASVQNFINEIKRPLLHAEIRYYIALAFALIGFPEALNNIEAVINIMTSNNNMCLGCINKTQDGLNSSWLSRHNTIVHNFNFCNADRFQALYYRNIANDNRTIDPVFWDVPFTLINSE